MKSIAQPIKTAYVYKITVIGSRKDRKRMWVKYIASFKGCAPSALSQHRLWLCGTEWTFRNVGKKLNTKDMKPNLFSYLTNMKYISTLNKIFYLRNVR